MEISRVREIEHKNNNLPGACTAEGEFNHFVQNVWLASQLEFIRHTKRTYFTVLVACILPLGFRITSEYERAD